MSIQSMFTPFPLFIVPARTKERLETKKNHSPSPQRRQRSGKLLENETTLPDLLTLQKIKKMYPDIQDFQQAYLAYFKELCKKSIKTPWGQKVNLTTHHKGSVQEAFKHITTDKESKIGIGGFSLFRASYLSWLEPLLSSPSTKWYQAWTKGNYNIDRMIGNWPDTHVIAVIQAPKVQGGDLSLVTFYPADKSINNIRNAPTIENPGRFFSKKNKSKKR